MTDEQSNFTDPALVSEKTASLDIVSINKTELFSKEECETILSSCIDELWLPSTVVGATDFHQSKRQKLRGNVQGFPFLNIREATKQANIEIYDFNLMGIIDQDFPQVFKYSENNFYKMHIELNPSAPSRKLSFIINLSDPSTYTGGELEFLNVGTDTNVLQEQGTCFTFPSYLSYKINPVTTGTRHIIVGHVHGAVFK
jgi:PKHD-type hydroxylase